MPNDIQRKLEHIGACAELWEDSGVSRVRAITRTAGEILALTLKPHPAVEAINFAVTTTEGIEFLRAWQHGDWEVIRRDWPECPKTVFVES